jgi:membrane protein implicated in regulation of membrane protease activity
MGGSRLREANMMAKQPISKFVYLGALSVLIIIFGFILLVLAAPLFAPKTCGFVFAVSRRGFTIALVTFLMVAAAALVFLARALRRRNLN